MKVYCECTQEMIPSEDLDFTNIEEGPTGADIVTWTCPLCNEEHKSMVFKS